IDPDRRTADLVRMGAAVILGGAGSALLTVAAFLLLSRPFGVVTRVELMELTQLNQPLLRRLQDEAPGTFQHSILVGNLAERAAASGASVRASADRSSERIRAVVEEMARERIEEGQFDECDISLRDLRIAADSFASALSAVYHPRVEYPEPTRRELAARGAAMPALPRQPIAARPVQADSVLTDTFEEDSAPPPVRPTSTPRARPEPERP